LSSEILITGGHVTTCDPHLGDLPAADVLIRDGRIAAVGAGLDAPAGAEVIDATGRLVLPGLIDTHRHVWQGALGAVAPQAPLMGYITQVLERLAPHFRPEDVYAGTLWGALQALNAGVTTVVDWAHHLPTPEHADADVRGLRDAGIGGWFLYGGTDDPRTARDRFAALAPDGVRFGLGLPGPAFSSLEATAKDIARGRDLGLRMSVHVGMAGFPGSVEAMAAAGLLGPDLNHAHANQLTDLELQQIAASGGSISICPTIDLLMVLGTYPATGRAAAHGIPAGLSVDTVTGAGTDLLSEMRLALAAERSRANAAAVARDELVAEVALHPRDVLDLVTLQAARSWAIDDEVGSLTPGKRADVCVIDLRAPHVDGFDDPVAAAVLGAGAADVETVVAGGRVVKRDGRLGEAAVEARERMHASREHLRRSAG
jgi:5-methylthioadenosine/S-adenosylhomocysteine deaminase